MTIQINTKRTASIPFAFIACTLFVGGSTAAQQQAPPPQGPPAQPAPAPTKAPTKAPKVAPAFTIETENRQRSEFRTSSSFDGDTASNPNDLQNRLRVGFRLKTQNGWSMFLQPQYSYRNDTGTKTSVGVTNDFDIHQGFAEYHSGHSTWHLGRQELLYGDQRLISPGTDNVGRSFDIARLTLTGKRSSTDLLAGRLGQVYPKPHNPLLAGVYSVMATGGKNTLDAYLLNTGDKISGTSQSIYVLGTRPKWFFAHGFDSTIESAFEFGNVGVKPVSAWAYTANLAYTFKGSSRLRFVGERSMASGGSPTGKSYNTFNQFFALPTNTFGLMNDVAWQNMTDWHVGTSVQATKAWTMSLDGHFYGLENAKDYWYAGSGSAMKGVSGKALLSPTGVFGTNLGSEVDATAVYAITKHFGFALKCGHFMPGSFVTKANGGHASASNWIFFQPTFAF